MYGIYFCKDQVNLLLAGVGEFVLLIFKIQCMKNNTHNLGFTFNDVLKFVSQAFKSLFQSSRNREFRRLKDYISS